ncbi:MAG: hypothetical protein ACT4PW_02865 [Acidimicrobiia bacterium]
MRTRSRRLSALLLASLLTVAACSGDSEPQPAQGVDTGGGAGGPVVVQVGVNHPDDRQIAVLQYMPALVKVPVGATVEWVWDGTLESHSVTFLPDDAERPPPLEADRLFAPTPPEGAFDGGDVVNSGLQPRGGAPAAPFDVTFRVPGLFEYYCVIHPEMIGVVSVVESGAVDTPVLATQKGTAERAIYLAEGRAAKTAFDAAPREQVPNADGTTTWKVPMGASTSFTDSLSFGNSFNVAPGDTVLFVNNSATAHTATYFGDTPKLIDPANPTVRSPSGPSPLAVNPAALSSSGVVRPALPVDAPPPEADRSFAFVVPGPGTYEFYCVFHEPSGMAVAITAG